MASTFPNPYEQLHREIQTLTGLCVEILTSVNHPKLQVKNPYKNTKAAAEFLGITPNALRVKVCTRNEPKSIKKGAGLYFLESDLVDYLESGRRQNKADSLLNCEEALVTRKRGN